MPALLAATADTRASPARSTAVIKHAGIHGFQCHGCNYTVVQAALAYLLESLLHTWPELDAAVNVLVLQAAAVAAAVRVHNPAAAASWLSVSGHTSLAGGEALRAMVCRERGSTLTARREWQQCWALTNAGTCFAYCTAV